MGFTIMMTGISYKVRKTARIFYDFEQGFMVNSFISKAFLLESILSKGYE